MGKKITSTSHISHLSLPSQCYDGITKNCQMIVNIIQVYKGTNLAIDYIYYNSLYCCLKINLPKLKQLVPNPKLDFVFHLAGNKLNVLQYTICRKAFWI